MCIRCYGHPFLKKKKIPIIVLVSVWSVTYNAFGAFYRGALFKLYMSCGWQKGSFKLKRVSVLFG